MDVFEGENGPLQEAIGSGRNVSKLRIYKVTARLFLNMVGIGKNNPTEVNLPKFTSLPPDYEVLSVNWNWGSRHFDLTIWSNTFDSVLEGEVLPTFPEPDYEISTYKLWEKK